MRLKLTYKPWLYTCSLAEGHTDVNQLNFSFDIIFQVIFLLDFEIQKIMMHVMHSAFNTHGVKSVKQNQWLWWSKTVHTSPLNLVSAQTIITINPAFQNRKYRRRWVFTIKLENLRAQCGAEQWTCGLSGLTDSLVSTNNWLPRQHKAAAQARWEHTPNMDVYTKHGVPMARASVLQPELICSSFWLRGANEFWGLSEGKLRRHISHGASPYRNWIWAHSSAETPWRFYIDKGVKATSQSWKQHCN